MSDIITIDGSQGEGGGQMLRTTLSLSAVTGCAVRLINIRAGRPKPGLAAQHLMACKAAAEACAGRLTGAEIRSQEVQLEPGRPVGGEFRFDIGTAGSTNLVLQTILPPLLFASHPSHVVLIGGTDNPWSPVYSYLQEVFLPTLARMGAWVRLQRNRAGWYPRGGGEVEAWIEPLSGGLQPLVLPARGELKALICHSLAADHLPTHILSRQCQGVREQLGDLQARTRGALQCVEESLPAYSPGTTCMAAVRFENGAGGFTALGARGKPAEQVGAEAGAPLAEFLKQEATVDERLADQLLLYGAICGETSEYNSPHLTGHLHTNAQVIEQLLGVSTRFTETADGVHVSITGFSA